MYRSIYEEETGPITRFKNGYAFLSNPFPAIIQYEGRVYPSVEHAYQAAKTLDDDLRAEIMRVRSAGEAKRLGRRLKLRPDWKSIKREVMYQLVKAKFSGNYNLKRTLLATGDRHLEEGNKWHDNYWGVCSCGCGEGRNELGKIIMRVRSELESEER